jgi:hypothetical protein
MMSNFFQWSFLADPLVSGKEIFSPVGSSEFTAKFG